MVMIAVKVPAGAVPGDKVDAVYDGRRVSFVVPPSVRPGQSVHVPGAQGREGVTADVAQLPQLRAVYPRLPARDLSQPIDTQRPHIHTQRPHTPCTHGVHAVHPWCGMTPTKQNITPS